MSLKVDSIYFFPGPAGKQPQLACSATLVPFQRLPRTPKEWYGRMVATINVPADPATTVALDEEVDMLFEEDEAKNARKRAVEEVIESAGKIQVESEKKILSLSSPVQPPTKKVATVHEKRVQQWFDSYHKEGRAGNIGLVPEPVRAMYPAKPPLDLEPSVRSFVCHFAEWDKKN